MTKYQVKYIYSDGNENYEDDLFNTEEEAFEAGEYGCSCYFSGNEILNMHNPGDYPLDDEDEIAFQIIPTDD